MKVLYLFCIILLSALSCTNAVSIYEFILNEMENSVLSSNYFDEIR